MKNKQLPLITLFLCIFLFIGLIQSMQTNIVIDSYPKLSRDLWTKIIACSDLQSKDTLRKTSRGFKPFTTTNLSIFSHRPLIASELQIKRATDFALSESNFCVLDNLLDSNRIITYALFRSLDISATHSFLHILTNHLPIDINMIRNNSTLLYNAVINNNLPAAQALLSHRDCNVNNCCKNKSSYLCIAARQGYHKMIQVLLNHDASIYILDHTNSPLLIATQAGHFKCVRVLLQHSTEQINQANKYHMTPLHAAALYKLPNIVRLLCTYNAQKNQYYCNSTPLYCAVCSNDIESVKILLTYLEVRALINKKMFHDTTLLYKAVDNNSPAIVKVLLKQPTINTLLNTGGITSFHLAAQKNYIEIMNLFLEYSPQVLNILDIQGNSSLHCSVLQNCRPATLLLLSTRGINPNILNHDKRTPLDIAYATCNIDLIQLLKYFGAKTRDELKQENKKNKSLKKKCIIM